jgi:hypothetical protein
MTPQIEVGADDVTVIAPGVACDKQVAGTMRVVASDRLRRCRRIGAWAGDGDE